MAQKLKSELGNQKNNFSKQWFAYLDQSVKQII